MTEVSELLDYYSSFPDWVGVKCEIHTPNLFADFPIHAAATRCRIDELNILLDAGALINQEGEHLFTPLHCAVEQGCVDVVRFLLAKGSSTVLLNSDGNTAEVLANILGYYDISTLIKTWVHK